MRYIFLVLFYCLEVILSAQEPVSVIDVDKQKSNKGQLQMSAIFSDIRYIPLEFNEKYPIGHISNIAITPEFIFVDVLSTGGQVILKYSLTGKFIEMIGSRGQGPGEYLDGSEMIVDSKRKLMYIRANYSLNVHVYDYINNKHLRSFPVENEDGNFQLLDNGYLWCEGSSFWRYTPRYYSWKVMDTQGKVIKTQKSPIFSINQPSKKPKGVESPNILLWKCKKNYFFSEMGTDTIYEIKENLEPHAKYRIKWQGLTKEGHKGAWVHETPQYILLRCFHSGMKLVYDGYYDKVKKEYFSYRLEDKSVGDNFFLGITNDLDGGYPFSFFTGVCLDTDKWYSSIHPHRLIEHVNSSAFKQSKVTAPDKKEALKKMVSTLQEDDNPVIIVGTLKQL
jgi:hypothetical protein